MKKAVCLIISMFFLVSLSVIAGAGPPEGVPPGPPEFVIKGPPGIEGVVFVHYPKKHPGKHGFGKPPWAGGLDKDEEVCKYKYGRIHWDDSDIPVKYLVNLMDHYTFTTFPDSFRSGIEAAFQTWEDDALSCMDFDYIGDTGEYGLTDNLDYKMDGLNTVSWMNISPKWPHAIAVTVIWYYVNTKHIIEADTILNSDPMFAWNQTENVVDPDSETMTDTGYYDVDVQNLNTHEAGHWLQLKDLYDADTKEHTMYGYSDDGELKKRSLECGDEAGIRRIYTCLY